ncbi:GGDEF domain-containing protein [Actinoplanes sp. NPDC026619]|uniref:GGDEF domain-containing protein n=1 Tax=Actinoplanes sp. NPDC026619 TaxID=3155798 RepID=UPI0033C6D9C4
MPLLRVYAAVMALVVALYALLPAHQNRSGLFVLVTLGVVPAVVVALRRAPAGWRLAWWLLLTAMVLYNTGDIMWLYLVLVDGRSTGDGSVAEYFLTTGSVMVLGAALVVVVQRGRRDIGGIIDSVITAVALTGILWDALLLPALSHQGATTGREVAVFVNVLVMAGTLGALVRISIASAGGAAVRLLTVAVGLSVIANVAGALAVDPATGARADWTNAVYLAAYSFLGAAALHPSVASVTRPGEAPVDDLSAGRLAYLGTVLALSPLVGGGRVIFGLPTDGVLIAISSAALIPLVMVRIARLADARRHAEQALHRMANSDPLTGLPNRAACVDMLTGALETDPAGLAVLFCDLDGFKPVNDRLGHAASDDLLIAVADHLRADLREGDLVSRFGGDEFVIITRGDDAVDVIADRIRSLAARTLVAAGAEVRIGVSVGVAHARPGDTTDDILTRADMAMYEAKKSKTIGALSLAVA